jgi:hypothetical protein
MSFIETCHAIQYDYIFPRFKEEHIDIDDPNSNLFIDIPCEEIESFICELSIDECEEALLDYGFTEALELYNNKHGLDCFNNIDPNRRVKILLWVALEDAFNEDMVEDYKKWFNENKVEGEEGGYIGY